MRTMKTLSIIGARPQFIKEAIVGSAIRDIGIDEVLVNTGQHYDANMSDVFVKGLSIKEPDYNLGVGSGTHAFQTATAMIRIEETLSKEKPDMVLVYGDTNATVAGALVAAKLKIPVAHVEPAFPSNYTYEWALTPRHSYRCNCFFVTSPM